MTRKIGTALIVLMVIATGMIRAVRMTVVRGLSLLATGHLAPFQQYLLSLHAWGPIVSGTLMLIQSIAVPVPVTIVMIANGLVFGVWEGMLISFVGSLAGAAAAYLIGRRLGRAVAERLLPSTGLDAADRLMATRGRWAIVLGRWVPGIPCDPLSYAAGIMRMPFVPFLLLTTLGLLPANLAMAFLGAEAAGHLHLGYWLLAILLAVGVWIIWRLVRRERERRLVQSADPP